MALVRNPLAMKLRGKAGAFTYYTENGRQIVRVAQNSSNFGPGARRSSAQQLRRIKWANLVNFYKANRSWMRGAFQYKKAGQSDYNAFMSLNIASARVGMSKDMAQHGECVVDTFRISDGSLPTASKGFREGEDIFLTNIKSHIVTATEDKSVAELTQSLIDNNTWAHEGVQLSIIQAWDPDPVGGRQFVVVKATEIVLSLSDERMLKDVLPGLTFSTSGDYDMTIVGLDRSKCTAVIISDSTSGSLKVSSESLWPGNLAEATAMSQPAWLESCVVSYGVDEDRFLDTGYILPDEGPTP